MLMWFVLKKDNEWWPVKDVRFVRFTPDVACAVVYDKGDERLIYTVNVNRVKYKEVK